MSVLRSNSDTIWSSSELFICLKRFSCQRPTSRVTWVCVTPFFSELVFFQLLFCKSGLSNLNLFMATHGKWILLCGRCGKWILKGYEQCIFVINFRLFSFYNPERRFTWILKPSSRSLKGWKVFRLASKFNLFCGEYLIWACFLKWKCCWIILG